MRPPADGRNLPDDIEACQAVAQARQVDSQQAVLHQTTEHAIRYLTSYTYVYTVSP
jgi:hypothetical protein